MNLTQLEYFLAASRTLSYTRAAKEMFTSRQNLSHAIHELEKELGVRLIAQEGSRLALTVEGIGAAQHARRIVKEVAEMKEDCMPKESVNELLNIAVCTNLISCTNYDISPSFDEYEGGVRLSERPCDSCYSAILEGTTDVAIVGCTERSFPDCEKKLLHRSPLYLIVGKSSSLAVKDSLSITDLDGHRLCMLPGYAFQFEAFVTAYAARGLSIDNIDVISNVGLMLRTVRKDDAVGIASASFKDNPPAETLVKQLSDPVIQMDLYVLYRVSSHKAPSIATYISHLERTLAETIET